MWSEQRHDGNRLIFIRLSLGVVLSHGVAGLLVVKDALDQSCTCRGCWSVGSKCLCFFDYLFVC